MCYSLVCVLGSKSQGLQERAMQRARHSDLMSFSLVSFFFLFLQHNQHKHKHRSPPLHPPPKPKNKPKTHKTSKYYDYSDDDEDSESGDEELSMFVVLFVDYGCLFSFVVVHVCVLYV